MNLNNNFLNHLKEYILATESEKYKELWDVIGILKNKSNQKFKFDLRPIKKVKEQFIGKEGSLDTKADKMVFETDTQWIIVDIEELHTSLKNKKEKIIYLNDILNNFEWNIIINK